MDKDESKKSLLEEYTELSKNSLIKVQFSCGGNSTNIDEPERIPIVPESYIAEKAVNIVTAREEDVEAILALLKANNLPVSDLGTGKRMFLVALSGGNVVGCVAMETYGNAGLLRSLAVQHNLRGTGIGQKLVYEAEKWSRNSGLKSLYLLTTTAAGFFPKVGWHNMERSAVPANIAASSEFASVCPSSAICMMKELE
jgi:amino-acid N-acetyltransferase